MTSETHDKRPRRRWYQFRLATVFLAVAILSIGGFWLNRWFVRERAREAWQMVGSDFGADSIDACEVSLRLYRADAALPFVDRDRAAAEHLARVERIWNMHYGPTGEWMMGVADDESLAAAVGIKQKVERYVADASKLTADAR